MVHIFRRYQQQMMIMITILVIISFVVLYNTPRFMDRSSENQMGLIYGKPVTLAQAQKSNREFELLEGAMNAMGLRSLLVSLATPAANEGDAKANFLWNGIVLKHESESLGIRPTEEEVYAAIQAMPLFQTNGAYDANRYTSFVFSAMAQRGLAGTDLEDIVLEGLRVKKIMEVLGATAPPSEAEIRTAFAGGYQKLDASVIRLKLDDFLAAVQVSDADLQKTFDERKGTLKTEEMRKVKFAAFILPTTDKPLEGPARAEELQKLQKRAEDFIVAMTEKGAKFEDVAAKAGVKVQETADFSLSKPPAELGAASDIAKAAFDLTKEQPNSDALGSDRGYYVLQFDGITPARPLIFEEAKSSLTEELKNERAKEALNLKATEIRNKIAADVKAGKSFAEATQAAGVKAEPFPPYSSEDIMSGRYADLPDSNAIMHTANLLNEGESSMMIPMSKGGLIVHLDKREPIDEAKYKAEKSRVTEEVADVRSSALFQEWMKHRRAAAHQMMQMPK